MVFTQLGCIQSGTPLSSLIPKMRNVFFIGLLTLAAEKVASQAGAWEKCKIKALFFVNVPC